MANKKQEEKLSPNDVLKSKMKGNKEAHFNYVEKRKIPRISSGSLILDQYLSGGFEPCIIRPTGNTESGKTASTLEHMRQFLSDTSEPRKGLYIKAEGRLSESKQKASGIKFVEDVDDWKDGTCFILKSNVFEFCTDIVRGIINQRNNDPYTRFWITVDSMNGLIPKDDLDKGMGEAVKVAGGALLTSCFLSKVSLDIHELGHYVSLIGQMRSSGPQNQYGEKTQKVGSASGGNAIQHYADWIFEYYPPNQYIYEDYTVANGSNAGKKKKIGHYARISISKGDTEEKNQWIEYPVKYGSISGSVFAELEIVEVAIALSMFVKKGAWIYPDKFIIGKLKEKKIEMPESWQGQAKAIKFFADNPKATQITKECLLGMMTSKQGN